MTNSFVKAVSTVQIKRVVRACARVRARVSKYLIIELDVVRSLRHGDNSSFISPSFRVFIEQFHFVFDLLLFFFPFSTLSSKHKHISTKFTLQRILVAVQ